VEATTGDRLAGLVPKANPGNRRPKLDDRVLTVIGEVAAELYATPDRRVVRTVISEIRRRCVETGLQPPHGRSVREHLKRLPAHPTAVARYGTSAAYGLEPHEPVDPDSAPPNGTYPGHVLHVDHTLVDAETVDPVTGDPLGRLFLTRGVDGFTGRECAHRFTYDHPSAVTVLPILLRFAARFDRLPAILVLDLDPAHRSLELRAFCEVYGITIIWRRTRKGRDGWRVERGFGAANDELFHALAGNTQASRDPRQMTRETNPRLRTTWDLVNLDRIYTEWRGARDERFDPTLGCSPREAWEQGLGRLGGKRLVRVDELMRFLAMPYADGVTRRIHPKNGVVVGYLRYENDEFAELPPQARSGEVRVDPDDASRVMVLVEGRTIEARCKAIAHHRVISRVELSLLSQRIKRDQRDGRRLQGDFETKLAALLARSREWERTRRALQAEAGRRHRAATEDAAGERTQADLPQPASDPTALAAYWERVWGTAAGSEPGKPA
jgi:putative transposase